MNQILYTGKPQKRIIWPMIVTPIVIIILIVCLGFGFINMFSNKILRGVSAGNVDISRKTVEEATKAIDDNYEEVLQKTLTLHYEDSSYNISVKDLGLTYTSGDELAQQAYEYGRDGNIFQNNFTVLGSYFSSTKELEVETGMNRRQLEKTVNKYISEDNQMAKDDSYFVSGDKLILAKGIEGKAVDYKSLSNLVLEAVENEKSSIDIPVEIMKPQTLVMDEVHRTVSKDPVNASYKTGKDFEVVKEENGITFDLAEGKRVYSSLKPGESGEVALKIIAPQITVADLGDSLFSGEIATYTTNYEITNTNRTTNLEIAAQKCNNKVLYPGDVFSFNELLGNRTEENGYKMANSFADGKVVQSIGGGICQVSSTLYNAVLRADLEVTERKAHQMYVQYVPQSTDATVVDETIDFKFKNSREYPIKIMVTCANGKVVASIFGHKLENEPTIDIETKIIETIEFPTENHDDATMVKGSKRVTQQGVNGYVSEAYKVYYVDGKETDRKLVTKDTYTPITQVSITGTKIVTPKPTVKPTVEPTKAPAVVTPQPTTPPRTDNPLLPPGWDTPESGY